jgi:hypothetical protein
MIIDRTKSALDNFFVYVNTHLSKDNPAVQEITYADVTLSPPVEIPYIDNNNTTIMLTPTEESILRNSVELTYRRMPIEGLVKGARIVMVVGSTELAMKVAVCDRGALMSSEFDMQLYGAPSYAVGGSATYLFRALPSSLLYVGATLVTFIFLSEEDVLGIAEKTKKLTLSNGVYSAVSI